MEKGRRRKPIREGKDHRPKERGSYFFFFFLKENVGKRVKEESLEILASTRALPPEKDCPVGTRGRGVESDLSRGGGAERPGVTKEGTLTQTPRMTTACRLVPTLRMAALRVAALSAPPPRKTPPGPIVEGQGRVALDPAGAALAYSVRIYHSAGLGCLHLHLHCTFCAFRLELFLQVLEK